MSNRPKEPLPFRRVQKDVQPELAEYEAVLNRIVAEFKASLCLVTLQPPDPVDIENYMEARAKEVDDFPLPEAMYRRFSHKELVEQRYLLVCEPHHGVFVKKRIDLIDRILKERE